MDATTFMQMQQEAQSQIDNLNSQIASLTQEKNDLINESNTAILNAKAQANQILDDASAKSSEIISDTNAKAQGIMDVANKSKADADDYVESQKAVAGGIHEGLLKEQDELAKAQNKLANDIITFNNQKEAIVSVLIVKANAAKIFLDSLINDITKVGLPNDGQS